MFYLFFFLFWLETRSKGDFFFLPFQKTPGEPETNTHFPKPVNHDIRIFFQAIPESNLYFIQLEILSYTGPRHGTVFTQFTASTKCVHQGSLWLCDCYCWGFYGPILFLLLCTLVAVSLHPPVPLTFIFLLSTFCLSFSVIFFSHSPFWNAHNIKALEHKAWAWNLPPPLAMSPYRSEVLRRAPGMQEGCSSMRYYYFPGLCSQLP